MKYQTLIWVNKVTYLMSPKRKPDITVYNDRVAEKLLDGLWNAKIAYFAQRKLSNLDLDKRTTVC